MRGSISRRVRAVVLAGVAAAVLVAAGSAGASSPNSANAHLKHIFVIMLENHSKASVIGDPFTPYITSLAYTYGQAANYYGVTHPSEPNYVASITGSNWGVNNDNPANVYDVPNLVDQLEANGLTWGAYMEALPADNKLATQWPSYTALYANKHDPFVLMSDIRNDPARLANVKPYSDLFSDLASNNVPDFVWISPDQCNDMHGGVYAPVPGHPETPCPYNDTKDDPNDISLKLKADAFVQTAVTAIMSSKAWTGNSAIFIQTDEDDFTGNPATDGWESAAGCCDSPYVPAGDPDVPGWAGGIYGGGLVPSVVVTSNGPRGYISTTPYNHYSLLTTVEKNWHLGYLQHAGDAAGGVVPMDDLLTHNG
jgi:hypothetical protein